MNELILSNRNSLEHLLAHLRRITALLMNRLPELIATNNTELAEFQGLYVSEEEINQLLHDPTLFQAGNYEDFFNERTSNALSSSPDEARLVQLQQAFGLSSFELDVLMLALAPELDLRYEKLYIYLQDDVTRRRPSVDLILRLLCPGLAGQIAARRYFTPAAPLLKYRLIELGEESQNRSTSLLGRSVKLEEGLTAYLLGDDSLDLRLGQLVECRMTEIIDLPATEIAAQVARLVELVAETPSNEPGYVCILNGSDEAGKVGLAAAVCNHLAKPLFMVQTNRLLGLPRPESLVQLLIREARLHQAGIYWANYEALLEKEAVAGPEIIGFIQRWLAQGCGPHFVAVAGSVALSLVEPPQREFYLSLDLPGYRQRRQLWENQLGMTGLGLDLEDLSSRFRLSSRQIAAAVATARNLAVWRGEATPTLTDLETACRHHSNHTLGSLAHKISFCHQWADLVLPTDQLSMLHEIYQQVRHRALVYETWGFEDKVALGKGLNVIFAGPSGTGKTMSASIIAAELKMDLYKIDLSNVVSKYIGETEKNLERIFTEASESNAILFFDEADAIFGKRSEVKDAHDRYANIETGYLLQRMEEYDGIVILATNLRKNLDEAFIRRMHFIIEFPFPEEEDRYQIWRRVFPAGLPLGRSVDLRFMARQFKITGGNIKNIALAAAFMAAGESHASPAPSLEMAHLIRATRREYQKLGKLCTETDFGVYLNLLREGTERQ